MSVPATSLAASVIEYEDVVHSSGETITKYIVLVKYASTSYRISKRYSEFKTIFEIMKDVIPADYKFPNKSLFHNSAQATKDRRVKGFDELLQILLARKPMPPLMERFLGINDRIAKSIQIRAKSMNAGRNSVKIFPAVDEGDLGAGHQQQQQQQQQQNRNSDDNNNEGWEQESNVDSLRLSNSRTESFEQTIMPPPRQSSGVAFSAQKFELIRNVRKEAPHIITSSMKYTSIVYLLLIIIRVVDISASDFYQILGTMCALGFVVSFIRINLLKVVISNQS